jgi:predicted DsbA family dithiol-disulfide isomerase
MRVEIWSDISCPWCFIGKARFKKALAQSPHRDQIEVIHRSFELDPHLTGTMPTTGAAHAKKYGMTAVQACAAEENLATIARNEGLGYLVDSREHGNTFDLHRLLQLAAASGREDTLLQLFYDGNFAQARSIYDLEYQVELAARAGLDETQVRNVLADKNAYANAVRHDESEAAQRGITGVPFFLLDRKYGVAGAQPTETFSKAIHQAWTERHHTG